MRKLNFKFSAVLMLAAMLISERPLPLIIYFVSAFLHEMGHLAAAKCQKIGINKIIFDFSGVRICTDARLTSYKSEIILAAAGPAVNLIVCITVALIGSSFSYSPSRLLSSALSFISGENVGFFGVMGFFATCSLAQCAINLMPVRSFDGGRILECLIALGFGEHVSERVMSVMSTLCSFILWTVALYLMLKVSAGLGIYVFSLIIFASTLGDVKISRNDGEDD